MMTFIICGAIVLTGLILTIKTKDPHFFLTFLMLGGVTFMVLWFCNVITTPHTTHEKTFILKTLEKENYYESKKSFDGLYINTEVTVCIADDADISHIETFTCDDLRIEYSSQAADGQMKIEYSLPESEENHIPRILNTITLRLPESAKE